MQIKEFIIFSKLFIEMVIEMIIDMPREVKWRVFMYITTFTINTAITIAADEDEYYQFLLLRAAVFASIVARFFKSISLAKREEREIAANIVAIALAMIISAIAQWAGSCVPLHGNKLATCGAVPVNMIIAILTDWS